MKSTLAILSFVTSTFTALSAGAETPASAPTLPPSPSPAPPSGIGMIITGSVLTGIGVVNLASSPLCTTSIVSSNNQTPCLVASLAVGGAFTAVGIPLLIVGVNRRHAFQEWKRNNAVGRLADVGFSPTKSGFALTWQTSF